MRVCVNKGDETVGNQKKKAMRVWVKLPVHIRRIPIAVPRECVHIVKVQDIKKHATNKLENDLDSTKVGDGCGRSSVCLIYS